MTERNYLIECNDKSLCIISELDIVLDNKKKNLSEGDSIKFLWRENKKSKEYFGKIIKISKNLTTLNHLFDKLVDEFEQKKKNANNKKKVLEKNEPKKSEKIIKTKIHSLLENQILKDMKSQMTVQVREPQPGPSTYQGPRDYQEDCSMNANQTENKSVEADWLVSEVNSLIDDTDLCAVSIISLHQDLKKISERLSYLKNISMSAIKINNLEKKLYKDKTMDDGKNDLPLIEPQKQTEVRRRSYNMPLFDNESDEENRDLKRTIDDEPLWLSPSKSPISVDSSPSLITPKKRKSIILYSESEDDSDLELKKQKKLKFIKKCENEREKEANLESLSGIKKENEKNYEQQIILQQEEDEDNKEDATWTLKYANANSANHLIELTPGSEIYVNSFALRNVKESADRQTILARGLMECVFTEDSLAKCSVKGRKASRAKGSKEEARPGLHPRGVTAILDYCRKFAKKQTWAIKDDQTVLASMRQKTIELKDKKLLNLKRKEHN